MPAPKSFRTQIPTPARPTLLYAIKQLERAVRVQLDETLKPFYVSRIQYTVLTVFEQRSDLTSAALARRLFVTAQTVGDSVTALERKGFIVRNPDPAHARRLTIRLTTKGRRLLDDVRDEVDAVERKMTASLSNHSREMFHALLHSCLVDLTGVTNEYDQPDLITELP